jgi:hypothetical protein
LLQLTSKGIEIAGSARALAEARATYAREHSLLLPRFLSPRLLRIIREQIAGERFRSVMHRGFGSDQFLPRHNATAALIFLMSDPELFTAIRRITGCGPLGNVAASIRRVVAGKGKALSWHDDNAEHRRAAITINLSERPYRGGLLQIRRKRDGHIIKEIANIGPGDAVLFRVSAGLQHRNTEVIGPDHKTAFTGWFRSAPNFERSLTVQTNRRAATRFARGARRVTPGSRIVTAKDVAIKHFDHGALLLNLISGGVFQLDPIGVAMYEHARRRTTPRRIARAIAASYDAPAEFVERDATRLAGELAARGLIEIIS